MQQRAQHILDLDSNVSIDSHFKRQCAHAGHTLLPGMATAAFYYARYRVAFSPSLKTFAERMCQDTMLGGMIAEIKLQRGRGVQG